MQKFGKIVLLIGILSQLLFGMLMFIWTIPLFNRLHIFVIKLIEPNAYVPSGPLPTIDLHLPPLVLFGFISFGMLVGWFLFVFFIVHIVKNNRMNNENKALWIIMLVLGNIWGMLIYWFMYVWRDSKEQLQRKGSEPEQVKPC